MRPAGKTTAASKLVWCITREFGHSDAFLCAALLLYSLMANERRWRTKEAHLLSNEDVNRPLFAQGWKDLGCFCPYPHFHVTFAGVHYQGRNGGWPQNHPSVFWLSSVFGACPRGIREIHIPKRRCAHSFLSFALQNLHSMSPSVCSIRPQGLPMIYIGLHAHPGRLN